MSFSEYYEETLYHLQDGILRVCSDINTPFYLTGGTALSRGYFNHRYSDDLDFFVNQSGTFRDDVETVLAALRHENYYYDDKSFVIAPDFVSLTLYCKDYDDAGIKLDFVNDIDVHYGDFSESNLFFRIDSIRNILSNKLGAIFRFDGKDIADIREIALHEQFNWNELLIEARSKDSGVDGGVISGIIASTPSEVLSEIKWIAPPPSHDQFMTDIQTLAEDLVELKDNSLACD